MAQMGAAVTALVLVSGVFMAGVFLGALTVWVFL